MTCGRAKRPFLAVLCLCCLTASACSTPEGDLQVEATVTTPSNTESTPSNEESSGPSTTLGTIADLTTTTTDDTVTTTGSSNTNGSSTTTTQKRLLSLVT